MKINYVTPDGWPATAEDSKDNIVTLTTQNGGEPSVETFTYVQFYEVVTERGLVTT